MALDEDGCMSDSIDAKQEPLSRLGLIHPKGIEEHSLSGRHQNPRCRLNQSIENVEAEVSFSHFLCHKIPSTLEGRRKRLLCKLWHPSG